MAGALIKILPKCNIVRTAVGTTTFETTLVASVCTLHFPNFLVAARIHEKSASTGTVQTASILIRNLVEDPNDPPIDFIGSTIGTASFVISGGGGGPLAPVFVKLATPVAATVRVFLSTTQTTPNIAFTFSLSLDGVGIE